MFPVWPIQFKVLWSRSSGIIRLLRRLACPSHRERRLVPGRIGAGPQHAEQGAQMLGQRLGVDDDGLARAGLHGDLVAVDENGALRQKPSRDIQR